MSQQKNTGRRKALAVGLAVLGVAGLSLASAAQLQLNGGAQDLVQAGTADLTADTCQTSEIDVSFTLEDNAAGVLTEGSSFAYNEGADAVLLDAIDAACAGKNLKVALGDSDGTLLGEYSTATAAAGELVIALADGFGSNVDASQIGRVAVTIFD